MVNQKTAALVFHKTFFQSNLTPFHIRKNLLQFPQSVLEVFGRGLRFPGHRGGEYILSRCLMHINPRSVATLFLCVIGLCPCVALGTVKIVKEPAVVQTRTFDRTDPPKEMPPLGDGEDALTVCDYRCEVNSKFRVVDRKKKDDGVEVVVKIYAVTLTTHMNITIWIPVGAAAKLVAHEEGHRQIAEHIYENAEKIAKSVAKNMDERRIVGHGDSEQSATQSTMTALARETSDAYLKETAAKSSRVSEIYDALTGHGTRQKPDEPEAIKLAFEQYMREKHAAAEPTK